MSLIPAPVSPAPQDQTQQDKLVKAMLAQTELYVYQPCPFPCPPPEQTPDWSMYPVYDIDPAAYGLLAQCEHLQLRLESDTLTLASRCRPFTVDACRNVREKLVTLQNLSEGTLTSRTQALQILADLAAVTFEHYSSKGESGDLQGTVPDAILDMLNDDVATLPATASPVEAYAQVARRWGDLEKAIAAETLQALSMKLQVMRLGLYQSAGQYLADQAGLVLNNHLVDEEWVPQGDVHPGRAILESCRSEPFLSRWPQGSKTRVPAHEIFEAANDK